MPSQAKPSQVELSQTERFAVKFMTQLEDAEDKTGELAALSLTLFRFGLDPMRLDLLAEIAEALPKSQGEAWWCTLGAVEREQLPTDEEIAAFKASQIGEIEHDAY